MLFPVVIHKDAKSSFGVTIPDISGCFTAGDTLDEAISNVQEAVEVHLEPGDPIPEASALEELLNDPQYAGGIWVMVDIDMSFLSPRHKRINVTLPEDALHKIDAHAKRHGYTRSAFLLEAAKKALSEGQDNTPA
ncbi:MAG: type II toxin-antitoxin system HicB family antitoxin [Proteobacteria bacterium]|nr:type II toxin-antitoxin system HicB family antitoxin [Pseudomonadota bacterium]MBU1740788.1 type II toxin-antitoxin system HicB family antitoxin [Pseudomonadota bacterium]